MDFEPTKDPERESFLVRETYDEPDTSFGLQSTVSRNSQYTVNYEDELIHMNVSDWRQSNLLKLQIATCFSVFVFYGSVGNSLGPLIEPIKAYYGIPDHTTSLIFLFGSIGYNIVALTNEQLHQRLGVRGVISLGVGIVVVAYLFASVAPPFYILLPLFMFGGMGAGCLDSTINSWIGKLDDSNQVMGILHGFFGVGSMISPPLASNLIERGMLWSHFYIILCGVGILVLILVWFAFRDETPSKYRYLIHISQASSENNAPVKLSETLKSGQVLSIAIALFTVIGGEASLGIWMMPYLIRIKKTAPVPSSYVSASYWIGMTSGRVILGFITGKYYTEITANQLYGAAAVVFIIVFQFVSHPVVLGIFIYLTGFFVGPIFPNTVVASVKLLPVRLQVSGLGFACAFGGSGGVGFPYVMGLIAETDFGLKVFPLICGACFAFVCVVWIIIGRVYKMN